MIVEPVRAAIAGLGWWGRHIVDSIQGASSKIQIVRGVELRAGALDDIPAEKRFPVSTDLGDVLDHADVHAIVLATPHSLHEEEIVRCASAGKHVFVEKPLALSVKGAEHAINACEAADVTLGVGHMRRFEQAIIESARRGAPITVL